MEPGKVLVPPTWRCASRVPGGGAATCYKKMRRSYATTSGAGKRGAGKRITRDDDGVVALDVLTRVAVVSGAQQSDPDGFGVVALEPFRKGTTLVDRSVVVVHRPSAYAKAHYPEWDYIAIGLQLTCQRDPTAAQ